MTREEQIKKQADIYTDDASNYAEWSEDRDGHNILVSASWDNVEELINDFEKQMEE